MTDEFLIDERGQRWRVEYATSIAEAWNAIAHARCRGADALTWTVKEQTGERVIAAVHRSVAGIQLPGK